MIVWSLIVKTSYEKWMSKILNLYHQKACWTQSPILKHRRTNSIHVLKLKFLLDTPMSRKPIAFGAPKRDVLRSWKISWLIWLWNEWSLDLLKAGLGDLASKSLLLCSRRTTLFLGKCLMIFENLWLIGFDRRADPISSDRSVHYTEGVSCW